MRVWRLHLVVEALVGYRPLGEPSRVFGGIGSRTRERV